MEDVINIKNLWLSIPVASVISIVVFTVTQGIDFYRRTKSRKRSLKMVGTLLGQEYRKNYKIIDVSYKIIDELGKAGESKIFEYKVYKSSTGLDYCSIKTENVSVGAPLQKLDTSMYQRLIEKLPELDDKLFEAVHNCHVELTNFNELLSSLIAVLSKDGAPMETLFAGAKIEFLKGRQSWYKDIISNAHEMVSGSKLYIDDFGVVKNKAR